MRNFTPDKMCGVDVIDAISQNAGSPRLNMVIGHSGTGRSFLQLQVALAGLRLAIKDRINGANPPAWLYIENGHSVQDFCDRWSKAVAAKQCDQIDLQSLRLSSFAGPRSSYGPLLEHFVLNPKANDSDMSPSSGTQSSAMLLRVDDVLLHQSAAAERGHTPGFLIEGLFRQLSRNYNVVGLTVDSAERLAAQWKFRTSVKREIDSEAAIRSSRIKGFYGSLRRLLVQTHQIPVWATHTATFQGRDAKRGRCPNVFNARYCKQLGGIVDVAYGFSSPKSGVRLLGACMGSAVDFSRCIAIEICADRCMIERASEINLVSRKPAVYRQEPASDVFTGFRPGSVEIHRAQQKKARPKSEEDG